MSQPSPPYVPRKTADLSMVWADGKCGRIAIAREGQRNTYHELSEAVGTVLDLCDGRRSVEEIASEIGRLGGPDDVSFAASVLKDLALSNLVVLPGQSTPVVCTPSNPVSFAERLRRILTARRSFHSFDSFITPFYQQVSPGIFNPVTVSLALVIAVIGLLCAGIAIRRDVPSADFQPLLVLAYAMVLMLSTILHELGHVFAVKRFGRCVTAAGIGWFWTAPMVFIDTSDMWMGTRRQRILVDLAGCMVEFVVAGFLVIISFVVNEPISTLCLLAGFSIYLSIVANLCPFLELDGYYALSNLLGRPHLRQEACAWFLRFVKSPLSTARCVRSESLEAVFFTFGLVYVAAMLVLEAQVAIMVAKRLLGFHDTSLVTSAIAFGVVALTGALVLFGLFGDVKYQAARETEQYSSS